jgi:sugar phosphate isomerase/epimerase
MTPQARLVLPSTTSHKHESLLPTLDVFARLGMRDLDLNLHHLMVEGVPVEEVQQALRAEQLRVRIVSGGWCDFFHGAPLIEETFRSVDRQVALAGALGVDRLRLFFGRLPREAYSPHALSVIKGNLERLTDRHPAMHFAFENHDGASLCPEICREILEAVDRPTVRMNFDPVNFEHAGVGCMNALETLGHLIAHVHLKGLDGDEYCEFGAGRLDLMPVLRGLIDRGYRGAFTVEYEGRFDRTLRLYTGFRRAQAVVAALDASD